MILIGESISNGNQKFRRIAKELEHVDLKSVSNRPVKSSELSNELVSMSQNQRPTTIGNGWTNGNRSKRRPRNGSCFDPTRLQRREYRCKQHRRAKSNELSNELVPMSQNQRSTAIGSEWMNGKVVVVVGGGPTWRRKRRRPRSARPSRGCRWRCRRNASPGTWRRWRRSTPAGRAASFGQCGSSFFFCWKKRPLPSSSPFRESFLKRLAPWTLDRSIGSRSIVCFHLISFSGVQWFDTNQDREDIFNKLRLRSILVMCKKSRN